MSRRTRREPATVTTAEAIMAYGQALGLADAAWHVVNRLRGRPAEVANLAALVRAEENDAHWRGRN